MSAELIDFQSLKQVKSSEKSLVFGFLRNQFKQFNSTSKENLISYTCLAFYADDCDTFTLFYGPHDVSLDGKCFSGCGYGKYEINPNNTKYTRYQWIIQMNDVKVRGLGCLLGVTSYPHIDTRDKPWCYKFDTIQYNFHSNGSFHPIWTQKYRHLCIYNQKFKTGDIILLDLDLKKKEFNLYINGKFGGSHKNINCDKNIKYRLACLVFEGVDFITIQKFNKFRDNTLSLSSSPSLQIDNLLRDKNVDFELRNHPNGEIGVDHSLLKIVRIGLPIPNDAKLYRNFTCVDEKWIEWLYSAKIDHYTDLLIS